MSNSILTLAQLEKKVISNNHIGIETDFANLEKTLIHPFELRYFGHLKGKLYFSRGQYTEALNTFQLTLDTYGSHIGLLCDFAYSTLLLGDYVKSEKLINKVRQEFEIAKELISENAKIRTLVFLGKVCMEWCLFEESISYYTEAIECDDTDGLWHCLSKIGLLRVKSFLGLFDTYWRSLYNDVSKMPIGNMQFNYEKNHALFLSDLGMFGLTETSIRVETLMRSNVNICDPSIVGALLAEQIILSQSVDTLQTDTIKKFIASTPRDGFEKSLQLLLANINNILSEEIIQKCIEFVSSDNPLGQFRIFYLLYYKAALKSQKRELRRYWINLVESLSNPNQKLTNRKWPVLVEDLEEANTVFECKNGKIFFQDKELVLPSHLLMQTLMTTLIQSSSNKSVENDLLIRTTWNSSLTSKNLDKLKINVARLNSYFQGICGLKIFIFSKQEVKLNNKVSFKTEQ